MKTLRFLLLMMIGAVSLQGVAFAESRPVSQQAPSQAGDRAAEPQINEPRNGTDRTRPGEAHQNQKQPAGQTNTNKRHLSANSNKAPPRHRIRLEKPAANNLHTDATGGRAGLQQTKSKAATAGLGKAAGHRSPPVPSPTVSVNGQHFRSSRDPGARLAVSGGPLTATREAINGTNMKRKP